MDTTIPTLTIGMLGHVSHGKSTLTRALSTVNTIKFKKEKERNITIKLGYASFKIYEVDDGTSNSIYSRLESNAFTHPDRYISETKKVPMKLIRYVSIIDCPGHESLMTTMLNGISSMDSALLLISAKDSIQPQTIEHLTAIEMGKIQNVIVVQNKIDLVLLYRYTMISRNSLKIP
jgi:translation initiation factor 2 subunit 3